MCVYKIVSHFSLLRVSEANEVPINSHIGRLDNIQTALKPLKKFGKN